MHLSFAEDCSLSEIRFHLMRVKASFKKKKEEGVRVG